MFLYFFHHDCLCSSSSWRTSMFSGYSVKFHCCLLVILIHIHKIWIHIKKIFVTNGSSMMKMSRYSGTATNCSKFKMTERLLIVSRKMKQSPRLKKLNKLQTNIWQKNFKRKCWTMLMTLNSSLEVQTSLECKTIMPPREKALEPSAFFIHTHYI